MGYSEDSSMVRVDFFKPGGKWYTTEAVKWSGEWEGKKGLIHDEFAKSLRDHFADRPDRLSDMDAVCLHPYHEHTHPIQIKAGGWRK
ncbi:MAG: hypothetical protein JSV82_02510 [Planctomycetota bacterium]|nr:MAG: hypothetical protein JSV82_02510 [Planctomycetota bacterium]